ncbi:MAG: DUF4412 domain-containing protein [Deltaproteobacteria bacterium]|nr:DUF4412 domain-containing protein [Deltaproteobacteria bacterium]
MLKKLFTALNLIFLLVLTTCFFRTNPLNAAELSADVIRTVGQEVINGRIYIKGDDFRQEMFMGGKKQVMIYRKDKQMVWMLMPENKMYMETPTNACDQNMPQTDQEQIENKANKKYLGKEKVNGYVCEKYLYVYHNKSTGSMTQWFSKKLNFPIKMDFDSSSGHMITEYKNIEVKALPDSLFEIPSGYRKMSLPGMMQQMPDMNR